MCSTGALGVQHERMYCKGKWVYDCVFAWLVKVDKCRTLTILVRELFGEEITEGITTLAIADKKSPIFLQKPYWFPLTSFLYFFSITTRKQLVIGCYDWHRTLEKNPYICRIEFFPPKINVKLLLNCICHKVLTYLDSQYCAIFESNPMKNFLLNQDFPFCLLQNSPFMKQNF